MLASHPRNAPPGHDDADEEEPRKGSNRDRQAGVPCVQDGLLRAVRVVIDGHGQADGYRAMVASAWAREPVQEWKAKCRLSRGRPAA